MESRIIRDDEHLSQYGSRETGTPVFWDRPRPRDVDGLSALLGRLPPAAARRRVRRVGVPTAADGVRYARVGDLRAHSFVVTHTPWPGNSLHVSVRYGGVWDDGVANKFEACFSKPVWHEESEGGQQ
jgi:hypothetical protein